MPLSERSVPHPVLALGTIRFWSHLRLGTGLAVRTNQIHAVDHPPSAGTIAPFTKDASSLASHEMAAAISSGCAGAGIVAIEICARSIAQGTLGAAPMPVSTGPGNTALERIPRGP